MNFVLIIELTDRLIIELVKANFVINYLYYYYYYIPVALETD